MKKTSKIFALKISIARGNDREENIKKAVYLIEKDICKCIKSKNSNELFIKVNAIDTNFPLACTHVDAVCAVLDIFYDKFDSVIIGDNSFVFSKDKGGGVYRKILDEYPKVKLSDLSEFESEGIEFEMAGGERSNGRISLIPRKAFTISLAVPKTHDTFVYTGCLKNMFGCVIENRGSLHATGTIKRIFLNSYVTNNRIKWRNLINVIEKTKPDLSILDAYEGMEGNGPLFGTKVHLETAMCSLDGIELDRLASKIYGFENVPYLAMLPSNPEKAEIIKSGFENIKEISKRFEPHYLYKYQTITYMKTFIQRVDIKLAISILKRSYRLKDKIIEKIKRR